MIFISIGASSFAIGKEEQLFDAPNKLAEFKNTALNVGPGYMATILEVLRGRPEVLDRCGLEESYHVWALAKRFELPKTCAFFEWKLGMDTKDDESFNTFAGLLESAFRILNPGNKALPDMAEYFCLKPFLARSIYNCPAWTDHFARLDPLPCDLLTQRRLAKIGIERFAKLTGGLLAATKTEPETLPAGSKERIQLFLPGLLKEESERRAFWSWLEQQRIPPDIAAAQTKEDAGKAVKRLVKDVYMVQERILCHYRFFLEKEGEKAYEFWKILETRKADPKIMERLAAIKDAGSEYEVEVAVEDLTKEIFPPGPPPVQTMATISSKYDDPVPTRPTTAASDSSSCTIM